MSFDFFGRNQSKLIFIFYVQADDHTCDGKQAMLSVLANNPYDPASSNILDNLNEHTIMYVRFFAVPLRSSLYGAIRGYWLGYP